MAKCIASSAQVAHEEAMVWHDEGMCLHALQTCAACSTHSAACCRSNAGEVPYRTSCRALWSCWPRLSS